MGTASSGDSTRFTGRKPQTGKTPRHNPRRSFSWPVQDPRGEYKDCDLPVCLVPEIGPGHLRRWVWLSGFPGLLQSRMAAKARTSVGWREKMAIGQLASTVSWSKWPTPPPGLRWGNHGDARRRCLDDIRARAGSSSKRISLVIIII